MTKQEISELMIVLKRIADALETANKGLPVYDPRVHSKINTPLPTHSKKTKNRSH